jgi:hypothetical protein
MENEELREIRAKIALLEASRVAMTIALGAVIATHPNHEWAHLHMTRLLEQQLAGGALVSTLTPSQKEYVRSLVETLGGLAKKAPPTESWRPPTL